LVGGGGVLKSKVEALELLQSFIVESFFHLSFFAHKIFNIRLKNVDMFLYIITDRIVVCAECLHNLKNMLVKLLLSLP